MTRAQIIEQLREYLPHLGAAVAIALAGVLFGLQESSQAGRAKAEPERWRLPAIAPRVDASAAQEADLEAAFLSDGPKKADKAKTQELAWRFVGTTRSGDQTAAVIVLAKPPKVIRLEPGAKLPNGEEIVDIENGLLRYRDDTGAHELRAFNEVRPDKEKKK